jgi:hypothetical protein
MFHVVFTNDDDINCEGDDLGVPADDFCKPRSFDAYLRVYAVIVGDFEYSDYSEKGPVRVLWLVLTLFGTVILLNVLIASKLQAVIIDAVPSMLTLLFYQLLVCRMLHVWIRE